MGNRVDRDPQGTENKGFKFILRALGYRNYRLYFFGQGTSLIGSWMQNVAMSWLVYRLTNSALLLGVVAFTTQIPHLFIGPVAGVMLDRWNRHRVLVVTQALLTIQALILTALVVTNKIMVIHIIPLSLFQGLVNAIDMPARQTFAVYMVERKDLNNAIALNSVMFNAARLIGPSLAGIIIATAGEGMCFFINFISYLAVIAALFMMKIEREPIARTTHHILHDLKAGLSYAYETIPIRTILLFVIYVGLTGMSYPVLLPIFAREILGGGPRTLGLLLGGVGTGALAGGLFLASRKNALGLLKVIAVASVFFSVGLILFSQSRWFVPSLIIVISVGFGMMAQMVSCNTLIQTVVDESKRGRIMSLYTMSFMGIAPFGSLIIGVVANKLGAPGAMLIAGIACALGSLFFIQGLPALKNNIEKLYHQITIKHEKPGKGEIGEDVI